MPTVVHLRELCHINNCRVLERITNIDKNVVYGCFIITRNHDEVHSRVLSYNNQIGNYLFDMKTGDYHQIMPATQQAAV